MALGLVNLVPTPQGVEPKKEWTYEALRERFACPTLDEATTLREVYLLSHTNYMLKTVATYGVEQAVRNMVDGFKAGGMNRIGVPMDAWLAIATKLSKTQARELVDVSDTGLRLGLSRPT